MSISQRAGSQRAGRMLLAGALTLSLSVAVLAQQAQRRGGGSPIPAVLLGKLNLTPEQQDKVKAATETYRAEAQKAQALSTPKEKRQANKAASDAFATSVKASLTPDQQKQLDSMLEEAKQYKDLGAGGAQLVGLNLTDEQKNKIKEIAAKYAPELMKLRASMKDASDKQAVRAQIRELGQKEMAEVKGILTPDQLKQVEAGAGRAKKKNQ